MKTIAIHQPNFLSWGGFYQKVSDSNEFIILDNVQYTKGGRTNRCVLSSGNNTFMYTMPVNYKTGQIIKDVKIHNYEQFQKKFLKVVSQNYPTAHKEYYDIFTAKYDYLIDFNLAFIGRTLKLLGIDTEIILNSTLNTTGKKSDLILKICRKRNASNYLSGGLKNKYLKLDEFKEAGINVEFTDYSRNWKDVSILTQIQNFI